MRPAAPRRGAPAPDQRAAEAERARRVDGGVYGITEEIHRSAPDDATRGVEGTVEHPLGEEAIDLVLVGLGVASPEVLSHERDPLGRERTRVVEPAGFGRALHRLQVYGQGRRARSWCASAQLDRL